jgi:hypothetical protein
LGSESDQKIEKICVEKKIADSGEMPNRTRNWREVIFWFELSARRSFAKRKSEEHVANPAHRPVPPAPRVPGSRSARGAVATNRGARANARRAARALRASLGASRRDESLIAVGTSEENRHLFALPVARAYAEGVAG